MTTTTALIREAREDADRIRTAIQRLDDQASAEADDYRYTAAKYEQLADAIEAMRSILADTIVELVNVRPDGNISLFPASTRAVIQRAEEATK